jgi:hypothetical protein
LCPLPLFYLSPFCLHFHFFAEFHPTSPFLDDEIRDLNSGPGDLLPSPCLLLKVLFSSLPNFNDHLFSLRLN